MGPELHWFRGAPMDSTLTVRQAGTLQAEMKRPFPIWGTNTFRRSSAHVSGCFQRVIGLRLGCEEVLAWGDPALDPVWSN